MHFSTLGLSSLISVTTVQTLVSVRSTAALFPKGPDADSPLLRNSMQPGPYGVLVEENPHLPNRTIYAPTGNGITRNTSISIFTEENGICYKHGKMYSEFLQEIASYGYLVIAPGPMNTLVNGSRTDAAYQMKSIDLAVKWHRHLNYKGAPFTPDATRVAIGGHSCGGHETIANLANPSLHSPKNATKIALKTGILLNTGGTPTQMKSITSPILIIHGRETDVVIPAADENFDVIVDENPKLVAFKASLETGH